jgi:hypothetical protein
MGLWKSSLSLASPQLGNDRKYTDLLSFAFGSPQPYDQQRPLYIDAEHPSCSLNSLQFRLLVRTLVAGLKAHNVQKGDCVLVHMGNSVSHPTSQNAPSTPNVPPATSDALKNSNFFYLFFSTPPYLLTQSSCRSYTPLFFTASSALGVCLWAPTPAANPKN